jgi:hypothetical protein
MAETYGHVLKTQANQVLEAFRKLDVDPASFVWELEEEPTLRHSASDYFFHFGLVDYGQHQAYYCPGESTAHEESRGGSWEGQLALVERWIVNLKREVGVPDLWAVLSEQTALAQAASADSPNTEFTASEREQISAVLREIKAYIEHTNELNETNRVFLDSRLAYLEDAAHRLGRKDWLNIALGVLVTVVWGLVMAPERANELYHFLSNALYAFLKTQPLLP